MNVAVEARVVPGLIGLLEMAVQKRKGGLLRPMANERTLVTRHAALKQGRVI
jgi:hypothetical protein